MESLSRNHVLTPLLGDEVLVSEICALGPIRPRGKQRLANFHNVERTDFGIHVPAARMSILVYIATAINTFLFLLTKHPLFLRSSGTGTEIGAFFTLFTLVTGGFRGRPMWGTFWVWRQKNLFFDSKISGTSEKDWKVRNEVLDRIRKGEVRSLLSACAKEDFVLF
ncbi:unnamed protein product [Lupinus luteus]|uniref:Cytochrome c assembly protein domain-containing protein n=1 Tax=Lupinus luteus TaxID=3873 RepID=A0AAV1X1F7_LUPLU